VLKSFTMTKLQLIHDVGSLQIDHEDETKEFNPMVDLLVHL
jgi:hypothetical protein